MKKTEPQNGQNDGSYKRFDISNGTAKRQTKHFAEYKIKRHS